jgi:SAM-dependent methyltransferase
MTQTVRLTTRDPVLVALDGVLHELERVWLPEIEPSAIHHGWKSLPLHAFLPALKVAWETVSPLRRRPIRFLDVGAGLGTKLLLVQGIYRHEVVCQGVELQPEFVRIAFQHGLAVAQADAIEWDGYGQADIVYVYRPCIDPELEAKLEQRVMELMRPKAVLILACGETTPWGWKSLPNGSGTAWMEVWQKPLKSGVEEKD